MSKLLDQCVHIYGTYGGHGDESRWGGIRVLLNGCTLDEMDALREEAKEALPEGPATARWLILRVMRDSYRERAMRDYAADTRSEEELIAKLYAPVVTARDHGESAAAQKELRTRAGGYDLDTRWHLTKEFFLADADERRKAHIDHMVEQYRVLRAERKEVAS